MLFSHPRTCMKLRLLLDPGSLYVMQGEARYQWKHSIPSRKTDVYGQGRIQRHRRVSLTFRIVIQEAFTYS
jgi:alkylated DNA repair dioxygenase AlkB